MMSIGSTACSSRYLPVRKLPLPPTLHPMSKRGLNFNVVSLERGDGAELLVSVEAPAVDGTRHRDSHHLQVVLDIGETMNQRRLLFAALRGIDYLVSQLPEGDTFGLVTFGATNEVAFPAGPVGDGSTVKEVLGGIRSFGLAEPFGGLLMGIRECQRIGVHNSSIVLISDSRLRTDGQRDRQMLIGLAGGALEQGMPVSTICMDPRPGAILRQVARQGGGQATQTTDGGATTRALMKSVPGLAEKAFRGISLTVRCTPDVAGFDTPAPVPSIELGDGITYELGDLGEGESRSIDFRLEIPELASIGPREVAEIELRWTDMKEKRTETARADIWANALEGGPGGGATERSTEMAFSGPDYTERLPEDDESDGLPPGDNRQRPAPRRPTPSAAQRRIREIVTEQVRLEVERQLEHRDRGVHGELDSDSNLEGEEGTPSEGDGPERPSGTDANG